MISLEQILSFKGIIFDMDGTLCDSEPLHAATWRELAQKYHFKALSDEEIAAIGGISTLALASQLAEKYHLPLSGAQLCAEKTALYRQKYAPQVKPFADIANLVHQARAHQLKTAIATGSQLKETRELLSRFKLIDAFDAIVTSDQVKHGKPAPDTYLEAASRLQLTPKDLLVLEDTPLGLKGAKAAGITALQAAKGRIISPDFIRP